MYVGEEESFQVKKGNGEVKQFDTTKEIEDKLRMRNKKWINIIKRDFRRKKCGKYDNNTEKRERGKERKTLDIEERLSVKKTRWMERKNVLRLQNYLNLPQL